MEQGIRILRTTFEYRFNIRIFGGSSTPKTIQIETTRSSATAEGPRDALSLEILSTGAQLHKKSHLTGLQ